MTHPIPRARNTFVATAGLYKKLAISASDLLCPGPIDTRHALDRHVTVF
jgi:hypothetical protein